MEVGDNPERGQEIHILKLVDSGMDYAHCGVVVPYKSLDMTIFNARATCRECLKLRRIADKLANGGKPNKYDP